MQFKSSKEVLKRPKRFKILLFGTQGVGKTYAAIQAPNPAVIDMEKGTDHYVDDFDFMFFQTADPDRVLKLVTDLSENPNITVEGGKPFSIKSIILDPIHVWELALEQKVIARRRKEERNPDYVLQPQDYKIIQIEKKKLMLQLINIDMNVIVCARTKDLYAPGEFMKKIGTGPDCDSRWLGFFDTVIYVYIDRISKKRMAVVYDKDRTRKLPKDAAGNFIPFEWSFGALASYLKDFHFDAESDVKVTLEMRNEILARHFETMFRNKAVRTAGVNGETLEKFAVAMDNPETKPLINKGLAAAEVESPYDLTQDMAEFILKDIYKKDASK